MLFSSNIFLFLYLPLVLLVYYLTPRRFRNLVLFIVNLIFYGWGEPLYVLIMLAAIAVNWIAGIFIEKYQREQNPKKAKTALVLSIVADLAILGFFKYAGFIWQNLSALIPPLQSMAMPEIVLPIGISFYIFQTMSYTIDVYRGATGAQKSYINFGTYVALFPQLIAGPIVRYRDVDDQLIHRDENVRQFAQGVQIFIIGLAKKVLLANPMGQMWDLLRPQQSAGAAWIGLLAYSLQIYFDFSGYSDMARGLGKMVGFEFMYNFDYPYISKSITEFWRRWHISLSSWFREYVYIPLGGNRKGLPRQLLNILIVWALTGLWHGASWNFVLWGLYFAVFLMVEKLFLGRWLEKAPNWVGHAYTLVLVVLSWGLFYFEDFGALAVFFAHLFGAGERMNSYSLQVFLSYLPLLAAAIMACTPIGKVAYERIRHRKVEGILAIGVVSVLFILCVASLVSQSYNPFIYFRF
ncbi:MAG: MBOAT family O-acyltransferase [Christensenellales bacterium]